jgi:hypothetical protein
MVYEGSFWKGTFKEREDNLKYQVNMEGRKEKV